MPDDGIGENDTARINKTVARKRRDISPYSVGYGLNDVKTLVLQNEDFNTSDANSSLNNELKTNYTSKQNIFDQLGKYFRSNLISLLFFVQVRIAFIG